MILASEFSQIEFIFVGHDGQVQVSTWQAEGTFLSKDVVVLDSNFDADLFIQTSLHCALIIASDNSDGCILRGYVK